MTKRDKLRRKLRNNPNNATMQDVETLLARFGFTLARISGSHHIYEYDDGEHAQQIVVPLHGRSVKKVYVQQISDMLDTLFPPEQLDVNETDESGDSDDE